MALEVLEGYHTGLALGRLSEISRRVSQLSGIPVPVNKAVVGDNAFRHEAGMVVAGVLKEPFTAEAYRPEIVGQSREILLGKKSGLVSVTHTLSRLGLDLPEDEQQALLDDVKKMATRNRRAVTDAELMETHRRAAMTGNDFTMRTPAVAKIETTLCRLAVCAAGPAMARP